CVSDQLTLVALTLPLMPRSCIEEPLAGAPTCGHELGVGEARHAPGGPKPPPLTMTVVVPGVAQPTCATPFCRMICEAGALKAGSAERTVMVTPKATSSCRDNASVSVLSASSTPLRPDSTASLNPGKPWLVA